MGIEDEEAKLSRIIKKEADEKIPVKPALGKIKQQTEGKSPKDNDEKQGDKKK